MRRASRMCALSAAAALGLASCDGGGDSGPGEAALGFDLYVSRAVMDHVGAFQFALLRDADKYDCAQITSTCLNDNENVGEDAIVPLKDARGDPHPALVFSAELLGPNDGGSRTQDVMLRGVPVGGDYQLVIEALSRSNPPRLLGSTCHRVVEVRAGENPRITPNPIKLVTPDGGVDEANPGIPCDPRFVK
ncbi:MAG: hypothetical protein WBV82_02005 [Myxococcaceae bacterium]